MDRASIVRAVRQPQSAAIAGLVFGLILGAVILLLHGAAPGLEGNAAHWADDPGRVSAINTALNLIPFGGIAFLWFIAVIRAQLGSREDRFFETVFLGSGLLFIAVLFVAAAALKAILVMDDAGVVVSDEMMATMWSLAFALLKIDGARMAAVFILSVSTMGVRTGTIPRWLAFPAYLIGVLLLLTPPAPPLTQLLFPLWVIALSIYILVRRAEERAASR